jgi:hypothetical protein
MSVRTTFKTGFVEKKKREKFDSKQKHEVHELLVLEMLINTCVHSFRPECNTGMSVMIFYTPPGVRILNSLRLSEDSN